MDYDKEITKLRMLKGQYDKYRDIGMDDKRI